MEWKIEVINWFVSRSWRKVIVLCEWKLVGEEVKNVRLKQLVGICYVFSLFGWRFLFSVFNSVTG